MHRTRMPAPQGRTVSDRCFYVWDEDPKHAGEWGADLAAAQPPARPRQPMVVVIGLTNPPFAAGLRPRHGLDGGKRWAGDD
jgi:hypothetical protein